MWKEKITFTQDSVFNLLIQGDIFSFPLVLAIVVPVTAFLISSLVEVLNKKSDKCKDIVIKLAEIVVGIINSLLLLIKFITSDFLSDMIGLLGIEIHGEKSEKEEIGNEDDDE